MASVGLPDGVVVNARSLRGATAAATSPTYGVYLCARRARRRRARGWTGTWRATWLDWPPLGVPRDSARRWTPCGRRTSGPPAASGSRSPAPAGAAEPALRWPPSRSARGWRPTRRSPG